MPLIAIVGPHGAGKTTFATRLYRALPTSQSLLVNDIARYCPFSLGLRSNRLAQLWILKRQLLAESLLESTDRIAVLDGCSLSHLAYLARVQSPDRADMSCIRKNLSTFDHVLWLAARPDFLTPESMRPIDPMFQRTIAQQQQAILSRFQCKPTVMPREWPHWNPSDWHRFAMSLVHKCTDRYQIPHSNQYVTSLARVRHQKRTLMIRRERGAIPDVRGKWDLPGGRLAMSETPSQAAARETLEETGYLVRPISLLRHVVSNDWSTVHGTKEHAVVLCFRCRLIVARPIAFSNDDHIGSADWFTTKSIKRLSLVSGVSTFVHNRA
jgi:8-oxo-dGTP pyrophosphatase MutT (NUDIX family)